MRMLAVVLVGVALMMCGADASAQHVIGPGVDLTWNECVDEGGPNNADFNCAAPRSYKLHACCKTPIDMTGVIAVDCRLDLVSEIFGPLAPFWQYQTGGCNASGLTLSEDITQSGGCASELNPWGDAGADAVAFITAYIVGFNGQPNRARFIVSIARSAANPTTISALPNYYLFHLGFRTAGASACTGCSQAVEIRFTDATFYNDEQRDPEIILGPDKVNNCATINHAGNGFCGDLPARNVTWGQLKATYR